MSNINLNEEFKDKGVKSVLIIAIVVVIILIIVLSLITFSKILNGEHVKIFSLEYNIPIERSDTINNNVKPELQDSLIYRVNKKYKTIGNNHRENLTNAQQKLRSYTKNVIHNKGGITGSNGHIVNGLNLGINGDQYLGIKQRHINRELLEELLKNLDSIGTKPNVKEKNKIVLMIKGGDTEMEIYSNEIKSKLELNGFRVSISDEMFPWESNRFFVMRQDSGALVGIKPARNVYN